MRFRGPPVVCHRANCVCSTSTAFTVPRSAPKTESVRYPGLATVRNALVARIADDAVRRIARRALIGGLDRFSDSTDLVSNAA